LVSRLLPVAYAAAVVEQSDRDDEDDEAGGAHLLVECYYAVKQKEHAQDQHGGPDDPDVKDGYHSDGYFYGFFL
jgi:hypothetical protein